MKILNKIDLHLHIDGSVKPETVYELSRKYNIEPECNMTLEEITNSMIIPDGEYDPDFLTFNPPLRVMQTAEGLTRITKELVERLEADGLIYAELRFAPQYHLNGGMSQEDAVLAAIEGLHRGLAQCKTLKAGLILCTMNHCDPAENHAENMETVHLAKKYLGRGVVGVDMAGYEERMPEYSDIFQLAAELEIPATTHSEFTVGDALKYGTTRIGHGYQAALIEELTDEVIRKGVTLEMCPDSSLSYEYGLTGDETHPLYVLYKKGAKVTVNTDNLTVLDTSLDFEYELCRRMGFTDEDIVKMNNYAIQASFADEETKKALLAVQPA
ncbi:MAG: adenosine deaminase [Oscillospiraceae bacterium]|nr:adenosine deaminase [Oscillospiraceae bacterium]